MQQQIIMYFSSTNFDYHDNIRRIRIFFLFHFFLFLGTFIKFQKSINTKNKPFAFQKMATLERIEKELNDAKEMFVSAEKKLKEFEEGEDECERVEEKGKKKQP